MGKIREITKLEGGLLQVETTDRISAFDQVLPWMVPAKGKILNQMTIEWKNRLRHICPNDLCAVGHTDTGQRVYELKPIPIECIVRGFDGHAGGWGQYHRPLFTPTTKEPDQLISYDKLKLLVGADVAKRLRFLSIALYKEAFDYCQTRQLILADTKFEFGLNDAGDVVLMDEVLTPDSSRYWEGQTFVRGRRPVAYCKEILRDAIRDRNGDIKTLDVALLQMQIRQAYLHVQERLFK